MVTCGGQATIPIVYAVSRVVEVPYAEIVASVSSASAGPGTRANIDEFTKTTSAGVREHRRRQAGQGDHHPQPGRSADDHARHHLLRDPRGRRPRRDRPVDPRRGGRGADLCARATGCSTSRSSTTRRCTPAGRRVVTTFIEVEGAGDYLPPYAGNLDIMTAAATKVGEEIAKELAVCYRRRRPGMSIDDIYFNPMWDIRMTDTSLRDGSHHKRHQFTKDEVRRDRRGAGHRRRSGHRGHPRRRPRRVELQLRLLQDARAGADQAGRRDGQGIQDRLPDAARGRHQGGHQGPRRTTAARSAASPPTAPRPTCRSSTSGWPANSAWRPSGS